MSTVVEPASRPAEPAPDTHAHGRGHAAVRVPAAYANPYLAGIGLGLVLLAAYVVMGRGLGASGALSSLVAWGVNAVAPGHAQANEFYRGYLEGGIGHPLKEWLVFEVLGVLVGGFLSGHLAARTVRTVEKGPNVSVRTRFLLAFAGGATLNAGSWAFMMMVFAGAYATAWAVRRQWR